jgi:hypothetical protein
MVLNKIYEMHLHGYYFETQRVEESIVLHLNSGNERQLCQCYDEKGIAEYQYMEENDTKVLLHLNAVS